MILRVDTLRFSRSLVCLKVDLIVANGSGATRAAKKAGVTIPVVMTGSTDPIKQGLVASLARPGGNITGLTTVSEELGGKLLEFTKELVPRLARVAVVYPEGLAGKIFLTEAETPARGLGVQLIPLIVGEPSGYDRVIQAAAKERADALLSRLGPYHSTAHRVLLWLWPPNGSCPWFPQPLRMPRPALFCPMDGMRLTSTVASRSTWIKF